MDVCSRIASGVCPCYMISLYHKLYMISLGDHELREAIIPDESVQATLQVRNCRRQMNCGILIGVS
jgi:hypothetical protein